MSRSALVTGGTGGIGSAIVRRLRANGYEVVFCGRDERRAAALERETGAVFCRADATDRAAATPRSHSRWSGSDASTCSSANAGVLAEGPLAATTDEEFELLVETNLTSTFRYGRALFAPMRVQGSGVMVLIASDSAIRGSHRIPAYSVVKAGVVALAELFGAEGAPYGIRANAVCPGNTLPGHGRRRPGGLARDRERGIRDRRRRRRSGRVPGVARGGAHQRRDAAHRRRHGRRPSDGDARLRAQAEGGGGSRRGRRLLGGRGLADGVARDRLGIRGAQRLGDVVERVVLAQAVVELLLERRDAVLGLTGVLAGRAGDLRELATTRRPAG